ncbi:MAG TPA: hypothetical protein VF182_11220 [Candidatus Binatia bacterium]
MTHNLERTMSDDTLTEEFFAAYRRGEHLEPEKHLLMAILQDAIHDYRKHRQVRSPEGKAYFREAEQWITAVDGSWIFSFTNICEILGLDADYVRRGLSDLDTDRAKQREHRTSRELH